MATFWEPTPPAAGNTPAGNTATASGPASPPPADHAAPAAKHQVRAARAISSMHTIDRRCSAARVASWNPPGAIDDQRASGPVRDGGGDCSGGTGVAAKALTRPCLARRPDRGGDPCGHGVADSAGRGRCRHGGADKPAHRRSGPPTDRRRDRAGRMSSAVIRAAQTRGSVEHVDVPGHVQHRNASYWAGLNVQLVVPQGGESDHAALPALAPAAALRPRSAALRASTSPDPRFRPPNKTVTGDDEGTLSAGSRKPGRCSASGHSPSGFCGEARTLADHIVDLPGRPGNCTADELSRVADQEPEPVGFSVEVHE